MQLLKIGMNINTTRTNIKFQQMASDLLMISIDNNIDDLAGVFCYWRMRSDIVNPPLEIGINTFTKSIKNITFFVTLSCFNKFQLTSENVSEGNILVDSSIFTKPYEFVDTDENYYVSLTGNKFACKFGEKSEIKEVIVNGNIEFYVDVNEQLVGVVINNLKESELMAIRNFAYKKDN